MNFAIKRIGRGSNAPSKYKNCADCGQQMTDYRIEYSPDVAAGVLNVCMGCCVSAYHQARKKGGIKGFFKNLFKANSKRQGH